MCGHGKLNQAGATNATALAAYVYTGLHLFWTCGSFGSAVTLWLKPLYHWHLLECHWHTASMKFIQGAAGSGAEAGV